MNGQPRWWSQPFPPTGAVTSEGIRNQLGRPPVDPLTVFVRETVQNSWDARRPGLPTRYRLELTDVSPQHRPNWQRLFQPRGGMDRHVPIDGALRGGDLRLLSVVDRGTYGLGGPTRADEPGGGRRDWVSFVLNVGERRDIEGGGGTYGYGKAVLYRLSKVGTVVVHTRTPDADGRPLSRLIGIALGASFENSAHVDRRPYTGRHWWGHVINDEYVAPLVDVEADDVAHGLGLPAFAEDETGTTLVVVDPDFDDAGGPVAAGPHLAETITWHAWPLMLPERGAERLEPGVTVNGAPIEVLDPTSTYPLKMFVKAFRALREPDATILSCGNPVRRLGQFALNRRVVLPMAEVSGSAAAAYAGVPGDPHHVCLMRSPELVVRYFEGPKPISTNLAYAGVFRALDDMDVVYAAAEPPTHDNWVHEQLLGRDRTFVKVTFIRLKDQLTEFKKLASPPVEQRGVALGAASSYLGGLIAAAYAAPDAHGAPTGPGRANARTGTGGSGGQGSSVRTPGRSKVRIVALNEPMVEESEGAPLLVQTFRVAGEDRVELSAVLTIATFDGREADPPFGAPHPRVHSWTTPEGVVVAPQCTVRGPAEVELRVRPVPDTITEMSVTGSLAEEVR